MVLRILLVTILTGLYSCVAIPRKYTYVQPDFSPNDPSVFSKTKLDTTAIYIREWDAKTEYEVRKLFNVMKFYPDGRFVFTTLENPGQVNRIQTPLNESIHYYKTKDGKLKLEVYVNSMVGFDYWEGNFYGDSLVFYKINRRKVNEVYKRI